MKPLPLPAFYSPSHAREFNYRPDAAFLSREAVSFRARHAIPPSASDSRSTHLLLIDVQKDFCFPEGTLFVGGRSGTGAVDDNARIAEFIYRNLSELTHITTTLDSHHALQIFSPAFWLDREGRMPDAHREVTLQELDSGALRPNPDLAKWFANGDVEWLNRQVRHYCEQLTRSGKYTLYLWPPHCLVGTDGHTVVGVVEEARLFHSYVRSVQSWVEQKGSHPLTENYSVLRPEVLTGHDGRDIAAANSALLDRLLTSDRLIVAGQASSHCVKSTLEDLLEGILQRDPQLAKRVYLLTDCMSAVAVRAPSGELAVDFTPHAEAALDRLEAAGMHRVSSTAPISHWP